MWMEKIVEHKKIIAKHEPQDWSNRQIISYFEIESVTCRTDD